MNTKFFGANGFIWWKGVIEDRKDPIFLGRVRVRIFGWHTDDKTQLPTSDLPWALPSLPIDNGGNPVGFKEGDWCWGFFLDGQDAQKPVVVGYIPGINEDAADPTIGFYDPTEDEQLSPDEIPRPPRMSPIQDYENTFLESAEGFNSEILPGDNVAFGQLTKDYSANNYKFDLNKDGTYDEIDVDEMLVEGEIFTGEIKQTSEFLSVPVSRYPLEDMLNEPSTSRLARNENITQTIVALKTTTVTSGEGAGFDGNSLGAVEQPAVPFAEPKTPYNAKYPYNHVYESESGHVIEVDDSPGAERLHWYHRSGSFKEIHPSGLEVNKSVNSQYNFVYLDHYCGVGYNYNLDAQQNIRMKSGLGFNIKSGSDLNMQVGGSMNATVSSDQNYKINGNQNSSIGENQNTFISENRNQAVSVNSNFLIGSDYRLIAKGVYVNGEGSVHIYSDSEIILTSGAKIEVTAPTIDLIGSTRVTGTLSVSGVAILTPTGGAGPSSSPTENIAQTLSENEEIQKLLEEKEKVDSAEGSPKYGYLIPNGIPGDVWKPISDSNGKLVVLSAAGGNHELREAIPTAELESVLIKHKSISGKITEWEVVRPIHVPGELIDTSSKVDDFEDGIRKLARFDKPGGEYPKQLFWMNNGNPILILDSGYRHQCDSPYDNSIFFDLSTIKESAQSETDSEE